MIKLTENWFIFHPIEHNSRPLGLSYATIELVISTNLISLKTMQVTHAKFAQLLVLTSNF